MKIEYSIWQGSRLLSVGNTATSLKEVEKVLEELNNSTIAKNNKFVVNLMKLEVK